MSGHDNLRPAVAIELHPPGRKIRLENAFHVPRALSLSPSEKLVDKRKRKRKKRKEKKEEIALERASSHLRASDSQAVERARRKFPSESRFVTRAGISRKRH